MLPVMHKIVEAYAALHKETSVDLTGAGSGNGVKALIDGFADVAMSSRALSAGEMELARRKGVGIKTLTVAVDALCPIVNPANPVQDLNLAQLRGVFSGKITNWSEVGGPEKTIAVISRDTSSGSYAAWRELVMGGAEVAPGAAKLGSSGSVLREVAHSAGAIGYEGVWYVSAEVKALTVDGVAGTPENARSGAYKLARNLWLFTREDAKPEVADFVAYVLGPAGSEMLGQSVQSAQ